MNDKQQVGRLALRAEGDNWNAYYALNDTMQGAIFLGSIRMGAVVNNSERKKAFMDLMRDLVGEILADKTGASVTWGGAKAAPENERSGNA